MVRFTVIIPVHNEAQILSYTLPSIYRLDAEKAIFVLDRCADSTELTITRFWNEKHPNHVDLELIEVKERSKWRKHLGFLYNLGLEKAKSEIVLLSQADIYHDYVRIKENIQDARRRVISFSVSEHPHISPWNHFVTVVLQKLRYVLGGNPFSGLLAISKEQYLKCPLTSEDQLNFDTQLQSNFKKKGCSYNFIFSRSFNLRPALVFRGGHEKLLDVGVDRYRIGKPFSNVSLLSIIRLTPEVLVGYMQAKLNGSARWMK
ncbi:MAG: glycosyltransferase family A protein, partial [Candidatus Thorarchaeota archaeon]